MTTSHARVLRTARWATAGLLALAICLACPTAPAQANDTDLSPAGDPFVLYESGHYFAFATGAIETTCSGGSVAMYVPHRSSTSLSTWPDPACFADALPNGPGSWATRDYRSVWAPTAFKVPGSSTHVLLYAAQKAGTGQQCIGRATSPGAGGPYTADSAPLICPSGGFWAIDPNVWVEGGHVYLQWRQDQAGSPAQNNLVGAEYNTTATSRLSAIRTFLTSSDVTWDGPYTDSFGTRNVRTVENPALWKTAGGQYYLWFSGNQFDSDNYATGLAVCGASITAGGKCSIAPNTAQPWLGWSQRSFGGTHLTFPPGPPNDPRGPGGMSVVSNAGGGQVTDSAGNPFVALRQRTPIFASPWRFTMLVFKMVVTPYGPYPTNF